AHRMTPEQGSSNRSIRRLNPTVRTSAKARTSAWGNASCSRIAAARSVRPFVITSSTSTILGGGAAKRATEKDSKCSRTVGRSPVSEVADLRTATRRSSPGHTLPAGPTRLSARASCPAAHALSLEGVQPGTGTNATSRANNPLSCGSWRLVRYARPAYRGNHSRSTAFTREHSRREASQSASTPRGEYTKQAANETLGNPSGTSQGQIVLRLLSRLLRLELARRTRERCSIRLLRPNTQPCLAGLTPYLFDVLGTGRRLGSLRKDFAARASAAGFRSALRGSRVRGAIEASLHPLPVLGTQPLRERAAEPALLHLQLHQRNPRQRLAVDPLRREAAVVDPRLDVRLAKRLVGERRPALAQGEVFLTMIGQLTAAPLDGGDVETGFGAEPRGRHLARGGQQVGVVVARVAPLARLVNGEI